jgi:hypothetical protein
MAFLRVDENINVNTQYIVKVKWKLNPATDGREAVADGKFGSE